jgi:hypothetical protein
MLRILSSVIALFCCSSLWAGLYQTAGTGHFSWDNKTAWQDAIVPPNIIGPTDTVIIHNDVVLMTSLGNRSIINKGLVEVRGSLTLFGPVRFQNDSRLSMSGTLSLLPSLNAGLPGFANQGDFKLQGEIQNLGGIWINQADCYFLANSEMQNYAMRHSIDRELLLAADNLIYDLKQFPVDVQQQSMGSIGQGPGIVGQVLDSASEMQNWSCSYGQFENRGRVFDAGIKLEKQYCSGGLFSGDNWISPHSSCAATELKSRQDNQGGVLLSWEHYGKAEAFLIAYRSGTDQSWIQVTALGSGSERFYLPAGSLEDGIYDWGILPVCSREPWHPGNWSQAQFHKEEVSERYAAKSLRLYPNPVQDYLSVQLDGSEKSRWQLYGMDGQLIRDRSIDPQADRLRIDLSDLENGIYLIRVQQGEQWYQENLVISK